MEILFGKQEEKILNNYIKIILLLSFVMFAGIFHSCTKGNEQDMVIEKTSWNNKDSAAEQQETSRDNAKIYVFITGCIEKPDVYEVDEGTRLYTLVELAGGFTEDADTQYLNMAEQIKDGSRIIVYSKEEAASAKQTVHEEQEETVVNINQADKNMLMTLPGIGESKADAIIRYREEHGNFTAIEDIMNISGIKQGAFDKIKDFITV